jgi:hypothetical protein
MNVPTLATRIALAAVLLLLAWPGPSTGSQRALRLDGQVEGLKSSKFVPDQLNYQGYLVDASDSSAVTATLGMTFRLFDAETKGAELWSETHTMVPVDNGLFQVLLGSQTAFPAGLFDGSTLWLQTEVGTEVLAPRKPLVSVAYSQRTVNADHAATAAWATDAQHAVRADTADHVPGVSAWTVSGDDVYRETGKVGIGTTTPLTELDVTGSVNATTYYGDGSNLTGISGTSDGDWTISGNDIYSGVSGNVGIGTAVPAHKLHVNGILGLGDSYATEFPDYGSGPAVLKRFAFHADYGGQDNPILGTMRQDDGGTFRELAFLSKAIGSTERAIAFRQGNSGTGGIETWYIGRNGGAYFGYNVGIGTTNPGAGLHVKGNGYPRSFVFAQSDSGEDAGIRLYSGDTVKWHLFNSATDDDGLRIYTGTGAHTVFFADQEDGDVGIGTITPLARLDVHSPDGLAIRGVDSGTNNSGYVGHSNAGVFGSSSNQSGVHGDSYYYRGVYGQSEYGIGVYGLTDNSSSYAGYFQGKVHVTGALSKGSGTFLIDHPLDPENKLLSHSFVESPENLLIYRGKIRLGADGEAEVRMPDYFQALTRENEATIHLTSVGRPFLTGYEWNADGASFTAYGESGREVSWMVMADRDDPVIHQLRRPVEEDKGPDNSLCDRGELLYPEAYGYPESMGKDYQEREEMRRLAREGREQ